MIAAQDLFRGSWKPALLPIPSFVWQCLLTAAAYYIGGRLGLAVPSIGNSITLIWAPTGIALAALLMWGMRMTPAIYLGAFLVNLTIGSPIVTAACIAIGNTLAPVLSASILKRVKFTLRLATARTSSG